MKSKGKKKRGKASTKDKDKNKKSINNMTLDSMFGLIIFKNYDIFKESNF